MYKISPHTIESYTSSLVDKMLKSHPYGNFAQKSNMWISCKMMHEFKKIHSTRLTEFNSAEFDSKLKAIQKCKYYFFGITSSNRTVTYYQ